MQEGVACRCVYARRCSVCGCKVLRVCMQEGVACVDARRCSADVWMQGVACVDAGRCCVCMQEGVVLMCICKKVLCVDARRCSVWMEEGVACVDARCSVCVCKKV